MTFGMARLAKQMIVGTLRVIKFEVEGASTFLTFGELFLLSFVITQSSNDKRSKRKLATIANQVHWSRKRPRDRSPSRALELSRADFSGKQPASLSPSRSSALHSSSCIMDIKLDALVILLRLLST